MLMVDTKSARMRVTAVRRELKAKDCALNTEVEQRVRTRVDVNRRRNRRDCARHMDTENERARVGLEYQLRKTSANTTVDV